MVLIEIINVLWCASDDGILISIICSALLFYGALLLHEDVKKKGFVIFGYAKC